MFNRKHLFLLGCSLLGGCSLAPHYERPAAPVATTYPTAAENTGTVAADLTWRQYYKDARLQALLELALANNRDLRVAALNVERVRALYRIQRTALFPSLDAKADGTRKRTPGDINGTGAVRFSNTFEVGLEVPSYELDFFGRVTSLRDQVLEQYLATQEAQNSAHISLVSSVARQYFTLLAAQEQLELATKTLAAADKSYELTLQTFKAGISSELDLKTAEGQRASYRATVATARQTEARAQSALVLLVGCPLPANLPAAGSLESQNLVEDLPAGLPSDLLLRRPDLRQAEHTLKAANANIGVARAAFFPTVKLTAFGGSSSTELSHLFDSGSGAWSFTPTITLPLFAAGKNRAQLDTAKILTNIEVANYEKAIQSAFRDVSDALAVRSLVGTQIEAQQARVAAAQRRYDLTDQRFKAGVASYLTVLLAEQELFAARQAFVDARLTRLLNLTALYASLGGGWQDTTATTAP